MTASDADRLIDSRAARYRHALSRKQFAYQVRNPPIFVGDGGVLLRRTGSSAYFPWWDGYDGRPRRFLPTSQADIAYMAGKLRRQLEIDGKLPRLDAHKVDPITGVMVRRGPEAEIQPTAAKGSP
jgi:hypothetical protein